MNDKWVLLKNINQNRLRYIEMSVVEQQNSYIFSQGELMRLLDWLYAKDFIKIFTNCNNLIMVGITPKGIIELATGDCNE